MPSARGHPTNDHPMCSSARRIPIGATRRSMLNRLLGISPSSSRICRSTSGPDRPRAHGRCSRAGLRSSAAVARRQPAAGSASNGSKRKLGGTHQRSVRPERARDDAHELAGAAGRAARSRSGVDRRRDEWVDPAEEAAQHDEPRVEHVDQQREPDPEPATDAGAIASSGRLAGRRPRARTASTASRPPSAVARAAASNARSPISVSQQPTRAAAARAAVGVDRHVPDLAARSPPPRSAARPSTISPPPTPTSPGQ